MGDPATPDLGRKYNAVIILMSISVPWSEAREGITFPQWLNSQAGGTTFQARLRALAGITDVGDDRALGG